MKVKHEMTSATRTRCGRDIADNGTGADCKSCARTIHVESPAYEAPALPDTLAEGDMIEDTTTNTTYVVTRADAYWVGIREVGTWREGRNIRSEHMVKHLAEGAFVIVSQRAAQTTTDHDMREQVRATIDHADSYDVPAIVDVLQAAYGTVDVDTIDPDAYWDVVAAHKIKRPEVSEAAAEFIMALVEQDMIMRGHTEHEPIKDCFGRPALSVTVDDRTYVITGVDEFGAFHTPNGVYNPGIVPALDRAVYDSGLWAFARKPRVTPDVEAERQAARIRNVLADWKGKQIVLPSGRIVTVGEHRHGTVRLIRTTGPNAGDSAWRSDVEIWRGLEDGAILTPDQLATTVVPTRTAWLVKRSKHKATRRAARRNRGGRA